MDGSSFECERAFLSTAESLPVLPISFLEKKQEVGSIKQESHPYQEPDKEDKPGDGITNIQVKMEYKEERAPNFQRSMHRKRQKHRFTLAPRKSLKVYTCDACPAVFSRVTQLKYHAKMHLDNQREVHECEECHIVFSQLSKLVKHKQRKHFQNLKCEECNSQFSQTSSFRLHMRLHSGERPYHCNECGATFVQSSHLSIHKRSHTGEKPYQCDVCKQTFKQISHLRTHERIHTKTKPFTCEYCGNSFIQKSSLNRHMRIHTGEKPYVCNVCQAAFCVKNNLDRHMIIHTGEQPFNCELCGAAFGQSVDLKRHRISHTGIKPFRCEECQATFSRNNNLKWHKYTHTGETPFKCDQCPCQFMKPRDLKKHKMTHGPSKVHTCPVCQQTFPQSASLKKHMMIHTGEKPPSCEECLTTFVDRNSLRRHMYKHSHHKTYECKDCNSRFREFRSLRRHSLQNHGKKVEIKQPAVVTDLNLSQSSNNAVALQQNNLSDGSSIIHQQYMTYQLQVQDPNLHSAIQCNLYNGQDSQQATLTYPTPTVGLPSIQPIVQAPVSTLMISAGPGQPVRAARAANNCQNHYAHVITMTSNNQWQAWCFCEIPNIPSTIGVTPIEGASLHSEISLDQDVGQQQQQQQQQQEQRQNQQQQQDQNEKANENGQHLLHSRVSQIGGQQLVLRPLNGAQSIDGKVPSNLQFHLYTEGQLPPTTQPVWVNSSWISQK